MLFLASCSAARLKYEAKVEDKDGKIGKYTFEKSYDVGGIPVLCGVSAWYFGGACWYYLVMPTVPQKSLAEKDALQQLDSLLKKEKYKVVSSATVQTSWKNEKETSELKF